MLPGCVPLRSFEVKGVEGVRGRGVVAGYPLVEVTLLDGQVLRLNERGTAKVVDAHAPLSTLFGYVPGLRGLSPGPENTSMCIAHDAVVSKAGYSSIEAS